jgi:hypothetical protein
MAIPSTHLYTKSGKKNHEALAFPLLGVDQLKKKIQFLWLIEKRTLFSVPERLSFCWYTSKNSRTFQQSDIDYYYLHILLMPSRQRMD